MSTISFADIVHYSLSFSDEKPSDALILQLIDSAWMQRLRDISQTANTRLVYMFSEHSRFGHSLGVAYLAKLLMDKLAWRYGADIEEYRLAVSAAALLHDLGHLAPGSHTAYKSWFPEQPDDHESVTTKIVSGDALIAEIMGRFGPQLLQQTCGILAESDNLPPWTWEIISGGGWNADRGNWCIADSIMAGVTYGRYNIPALTDAIELTQSKHLALKENRLDAMTHFVVSRHAMYRQVYQHRVMLASDTLSQAIVQRARDLLACAELEFADETMLAALRSKKASELPLPVVFEMRESWWRYHLSRWRNGKDCILADLADRLLHRRLFKTVRVAPDQDYEQTCLAAEEAVRQAGFDPRYYLHKVQTSDMHSGDRHQSMLVQMDDGRLLNLADAEPLFEVLVNYSGNALRTWLAMPAQAKALMQRAR